MKNKIKLNCLVMALCLMGCGLLTACDNDSTEVARQDVKINLILNNVVSNFTTYQRSDKEMPTFSNGTTRIVAKVLVYDDNGKLTSQVERQLPDYSPTRVVVQTSVSGSNPLLVCLTYAQYVETGSGQVTDAYQISGEQSLSTLKISDINSKSSNKIPWMVLGGAIVQLGSQSDNVDIAAEPLGALVMFNWRNIHAHDHDTPAPNGHLIYYKDNNIITVKNRKFDYSTSLQPDIFYYENISPSRFTSTNVYGYAFLKPGRHQAFGYGAYSPSDFEEDDEQITGRSDLITVTVSEDKQYELTLDCSDYALTVSEVK